MVGQGLERKGKEECKRRAEEMQVKEEEEEEEENDEENDEVQARLPYLSDL